VDSKFITNERKKAHVQVSAQKRAEELQVDQGNDGTGQNPSGRTIIIQQSV
jgi:hypothetical protein